MCSIQNILRSCRIVNIAVDRIEALCHKRVRIPVMKKLLLAFFAICPLALGQSAAGNYRRAVVRSGPEPGIRFTSGLSVCDEALRNGHWVSRYWLSSGMVKPENHLDHERSLFGGLPLDAF